MYRSSTHLATEPPPKRSCTEHVRLQGYLAQARSRRAAVAMNIDRVLCTRLLVLFLLATSASTAFAQVSPQRWELHHDARQGTFSIRDITYDTIPFLVFPRAAEHNIVIREGRLGINTLSPHATLEIYAPRQDQLDRRPALLVNQEDPAADVAHFQQDGRTIASVDHTGKGIFNGGTQNGGADLAEAFAAEGDLAAYEPGDVLILSTRTDRTVEKSTTAYSTLVVGVYATKPGVLLTESTLHADLSETLPVGVVGIIPTKVSSENGPIRRGDLLVTSATVGHAMRGDIDDLSFGMVLGKALEDFTKEGTGLIRVLVNAK